MNAQEPNTDGTEVWKASSRHTKDKAILILISLVMIVFASEAIRVALVAWVTGITPMIFGLMPTRELRWLDSLGAIAVALAGIGFVGWYLLRLLLRGMPRRLTLVEKVGGEPAEPEAVDETACLVASYDGAFKPSAYFFFSDITEIDAVARGTMGGGGHQVRLRMRDRRLAQVVARLDTGNEAEALVRRLEAERSRIGRLDADIHG